MDFEKQYIDLVKNILENGTTRLDRTGVGTKAIFGTSLKHDMSLGFPLLTLKKVFWKSSIKETLWMISGNTNIKTLQESGVNIWNEWADESGNLGPVYGHNWRGFGVDPKKISDKVTLPNGGFDQILDLETNIKTSPYSRRHLVSAWDPSRVKDMNLPPCHVMWQVYVEPISNKMDLMFYMRSADVFLGLPWDIAMYGFILEMLAKSNNMTPGTLHCTIGDCHIYNNHVTACNELLTRTPKSYPSLELVKKPGLVDYTLEDFNILSYDPHPHIPVPVAV